MAVPRSLEPEAITYLRVSRETTTGGGVPFAPDRLEATGGPVPVVENVPTSPFQTAATHFGFSRTGRAGRNK